MTSAIARATSSREDIEPFTTSTRSLASTTRLWQNARTIAPLKRVSARNAFKNVCPTFPVAPVTKIRMRSVYLLLCSCRGLGEVTVFKVFVANAKVDGAATSEPDPRFFCGIYLK